MTSVQEDKLALVVKESGLTAEGSAALLEAFQPHFNEASTLVAEASTISVTDATQVTEIKRARAMRLKLKAVRVESEKKRKALKEDSLRTGQAIDKVAKVIGMMTEGAESALLEMEQVAERAEAARKAELKRSREILLAPYGVDVAFYRLGDMPEETFAKLLDSERTAHAARVEAAKKAESDRLAAEKARAEEEARIRAENERLRLEKEAADRALKLEQEKAAAEARAAEEAARIEREKIEAAARAEKAKADAALKAEREAREALEAKARAEAKAAADKAAAEARAARKAAAAPDREKLIVFANSLRDIHRPSLSSDGAKARRRSWIELYRPSSRSPESLSPRRKHSNSQRSPHAGRTQTQKAHGEEGGVPHRGPDRGQRLGGRARRARSPRHGCGHRVDQEDGQ